MEATSWEMVSVGPDAVRIWFAKLGKLRCEVHEVLHAPGTPRAGARTFGWSVRYVSKGFYGPAGRTAVCAPHEDVETAEQAQRECLDAARHVLATWNTDTFL